MQFEGLAVPMARVAAGTLHSRDSSISITEIPNGSLIPTLDGVARVGIYVAWCRSIKFPRSYLFAAALSSRLPSWRRKSPPLSSSWLLAAATQHQHLAAVAASQLNSPPTPIAPLIARTPLVATRRRNLACCPRLRHNPTRRRSLLRLLPPRSSQNPARPTSPPPKVSHLFPDPAPLPKSEF
ncbi:hypothetical protein NL676_035190 [Syzygium grande]|nr:hypothetical protein NL676_035190 [Syzygium grande]